MKLVFVYNADAGWLNGALDSAHKLISPSTYKCSLCAVTHHPLGMKKRWARFIESLPCELEFLHRGEARQRYDVGGTAWPAVLREDHGQASVWVASEELAAATTLDQLETLIRERLAHDPPHGDN